MRKKKKTIVLLVILIALLIAGAIYLVSISAFLGQGPYSNKDLSNYIELADYEQIRADIVDELNQNGQPDEDAINEAKRQIWSRLQSESTVIKYPSSRVKKLYNQNMDYHEALAGEYGYTDFDEYITNQFGSTRAEFEDYITQYAQSQVANEMLIYSLGKNLSLEVSDEEYEAYLEEALEESELTRESFQELYQMTIEEYGEEYQLRMNLLQQKVMDYMVS